MKERVIGLIFYLQWMSEYNPILEKIILGDILGQVADISAGWGKQFLHHLDSLDPFSLVLTSAISLQPFLSILWMWLTPFGKYLIQTGCDLIRYGLATLLAWYTVVHVKGGIGDYPTWSWLSSLYLKSLPEEIFFFKQYVCWKLQESTLMTSYTARLCLWVPVPAALSWSITGQIVRHWKMTQFGASFTEYGSWWSFEGFINNSIWWLIGCVTPNYWIWQYKVYINDLLGLTRLVIDH